MPDTRASQAPERLVRMALRVLRARASAFGYADAAAAGQLSNLVLRASYRPVLHAAQSVDGPLCEYIAPYVSLRAHTAFFLFN